MSKKFMNFLKIKFGKNKIGLIIIFLKKDFHEIHFSIIIKKT